MITKYKTSKVNFHNRNRFLISLIILFIAWNGFGEALTANERIKQSLKAVPANELSRSNEVTEPLFFYNWHISYPFDIEGLTFEEYKNELGTIFSFIENHGYNAILIDVVFLDGKYLFDSPTLQSLKWKSYKNDYLKIITDKANEWSKANGKEIPIFVNFEVIAHRNLEIASKMKYFPRNKKGKVIPRKVSTKKLITIIEELSQYKIAGVYSEALQKKQLYAVQKRAKELGLLSFQSGDADILYKGNFDFYSGYSYSLETIPDSMVYNDLTMLFAKMNDKKTMTTTSSGWGYNGDSEKNMLLFNSIRHNPDAYSLYIWQQQQIEKYLMPPANFAVDIKNDVMSIVNRQRSNKPVANLVVNYPNTKSTIFGDFKPIMGANLNFILNALYASGYEVELSFSPKKNADLYYIAQFPTTPLLKSWKRDPQCTAENEEFCRKYYWLVYQKNSYNVSDQEVENLKGDTFLDFSTELLDLVKSEKPVVVHLLDELVERGNQNISANYNSLLNYFDAEKKGTLNQLPQSIVYQNSHYKCEGVKSTISEIDSTVVLNDLEVPAKNVLLSVRNDIPLFVQKNNDYLITGNNLHIELSTIFAKLHKNTITSPSDAYIVYGEDVISALAINDTSIDLNLPGSSLEYQELIYDNNGNTIQSNTIKSTSPYSTTLKKEELLILKPKKQ